MRLLRAVLLLLAVPLLGRGGDSPIERMEAVTVRILARHDGEASSGTGFIVGDGSYVVTNHHVIAGGREIVVLGKGLRADVDRVLADSPEKDLAILHLHQNSNRPSALLVARSGVTKTETVLAAGFPGVADEQNPNRDDFVEVKFSRGIISAVERGKHGVRLYQTDAPLNPGNSGGPLFDECGRVAGINTMKAVSSVVVGDGEQGSERVLYGEGVAWAIQSDELVDLLLANNIEPNIQTNTCVVGVSTVSAANMQTKSVEPAKSRPNWILVIGIGVVILALLGAIAYGMIQRRRSLEQPAPPPAFLNPRARLRCLSGPHSGLEFLISTETILLGRDPSVSQIVFEPQDSMISKRHCSLLFDPSSNSLVLDDLGSTNGTFLENGARLQPGVARHLPVNSRFYLGDRDHMFQVCEEIR